MTKAAKANPGGKAGYHHGDLRAALIAEGLRMLEVGEDADLSLRELARAVGVSATAVYRHFPDKDALREALGLAAYDRLGDAQRVAAMGLSSISAEFEAIGRVYVRFALDHPAWFRLMTSMRPHDLFDTALDDKDEAARLLRAYAIKLAGEGAGDAQVRIVATRSWALVHGLAVLMLDGYAPRDTALIDAVVNAHALGMGSRQ